MPNENKVFENQILPNPSLASAYVMPPLAETGTLTKAAQEALKWEAINTTFASILNTMLAPTNNWRKA
jgi:hypothetical protein